MPTAINALGERKRLPTLGQATRPDGTRVFPDEMLEIALRNMPPANFGQGMTFFNPNPTMVKWLASYANNRVIVDIGCGNGNLLRELHMTAQYTRVAGIEPRWDPMAEVHINRWPIERRLQVVSEPVTGFVASSLIKAATPESMLLVCCRPAHCGYCADALRLKPAGVEFLYISKPENWQKYDDLEEFQDTAKLIAHEGAAEDNELVWSVV